MHRGGKGYIGAEEAAMHKEFTKSETIMAEVNPHTLDQLNNELIKIPIS
jgi:hypothetical protein